VEAAIGTGPADLADALDRLGQRELFAGHGGDEAAAADLAARLEATVDARELAPGRRVRFTREQPAEDDPVAPHQRAGFELDSSLSEPRRRLCPPRIHDR